VATQALQPQTQNFTLDSQSAGVTVFPVMDANGNPLDVSSGWSIFIFRYYPASTPNVEVNGIDLSTFGSFVFGNGKVTWNTPNQNGIAPQNLMNTYILLLSNDGGTTGSLACVGNFTWDIENGLLY
jgi:hypothetical protein